jgi:hypothetical protein
MKGDSDLNLNWGRVFRCVRKPFPSPSASCFVSLCVLLSFRMISDTRIECRNASSQRKATRIAPTGPHRGGVEPGSPGSVGLDGFLSSLPQRGPYLPSLRHQPSDVLSLAALRAMERAREEKEAHGEIETAHPGYLGTQDTYYVGTIKSVGRIYQQTFLDTYAKVAFVKLYDRKNALVAADLLNDRVLPFFEEHEIPLLRVLTDRGTEYCGQREHHEYGVRDGI